MGINILFPFGGNTADEHFLSFFQFPPKCLRKLKERFLKNRGKADSCKKNYFCCMNIFRLAAELFLIYVFYKLIFDFIIPVYRSSKKIKKQFGEMQSKMQSSMNSFQNQQKPSQHKPSQPEFPVEKEGDYIEFEEVKN